MSKRLSLQHIDKKIRSLIYEEDHASDAFIQGVKVIPLKNHVVEDGDFCELLTLNEKGELDAAPGFKIIQLNRTRLLPHSVKAWHLHLYKDEIWYVAPLFQLFVGLWDLREHSKTKGKTMRLSIGGGASQLLYIPAGVAKGSANFTYLEINLYFFVNKRYDKNDPDEKRLKWNVLGEQFWSMQKK